MESSAGMLNAFMVIDQGCITEGKDGIDLVSGAPLTIQGADGPQQPPRR